MVVNMCIYMETNPAASAIRGKLVARRPSATRAPHGRARNPRQTRRPPLPALARQARRAKGRARASPRDQTPRSPPVRTRRRPSPVARRSPSPVAPSPAGARPPL